MLKVAHGNIEEAYQSGSMADSADTLEEKIKAHELRPGARVLEDPEKSEKSVWENGLYTSTLLLQGMRDNRHSFKVDHGATYKSASIDPTIYDDSQGTEFIIIKKDELKGAESDYAIRADKYEDIKVQLCNARGGESSYLVNDLEKAGGFKLNSWSSPEEIKKNDLWIEFFIRENNPPPEDYKIA
ncbi:hypothetical protein KY347_00045 [Candidatus Woesearchaeota archaeon]|nr:hypothetical protein [Candidatus Woesearchaeota archaeon]